MDATTGRENRLEKRAQEAAQARAALIVATLSSFLTPFMGSAVTVALPDIADEFGLGAVALSWVPTAYLLASATFLLPLGRFADIHGRKRIFLLGIAIYTLASVLLAAAWSGPVLLACRAVQGIGSAMIFCTSVAILLSVYPASQRGRVLGVNVAAVYCGLSLGPVLGGQLTQHFGWRSIFIFTAALGVITLTVAVTRLKSEWAEARGEPYDSHGALLYSLSFMALVGAFTQLPERAGIISLVIGVIGLAGFVLWELASDAPLIRMQLFVRNTVFAFSNLAALINYAATFAVGFYLSLFLQHIKKLTPGDAGLVLLVQPAVMAVFSPLAGRLSDRIQPRIVASAGMLILTGGLVALAFLDTHTPVWYVAACLFGMGIGFALFSSPNANAIMSSVERPMYGVAAATMSTMRQIGHALSMAIVVLILSMYLGAAKLEPSVHPQFLAGQRTCFIVYAAICSLGVLASLARGNLKRQ